MKKNIKKCIIFFPDWRIGNPYQSLLSKSLEHQDVRVKFSNYAKPSLLRLKKTLNETEKPDIIHLHWTHPYFEHFTWDRGWRFKLKLLCLAVDLCLVRLQGIKIIWTVHNLISHENRKPENELACRRVIAYFCHKMIAHSESAKQLIASTYQVNVGKISVIHHGNYCNSYKVEDGFVKQAQLRYGLQKTDTVLLFIGAIRKYKGIKELISAFEKLDQHKIKLVIAGKPLEQDEYDWLSEMASKNTGLSIDLRFIPDEEIASIVSVADAVIIPYLKTLTSGSAILAMSFGKALILPNKASIFDMPGAEGAVYYDDTDENGLTTVLSKIDSYNFKAMGAFNLQLSQTLDWDTLARKMIEEVYR